MKQKKEKKENAQICMCNMVFLFIVSYQRLGLSVDWRYLKSVDFFHHFGEAL